MFGSDANAPGNSVRPLSDKFTQVAAGPAATAFGTVLYSVVLSGALHGWQADRNSTNPVAIAGKILIFNRLGISVSLASTLPYAFGDEIYTCMNPISITTIHNMKTICKSLLSAVVVALSINGANSAPVFNSNEGIDYMVGSSMLTPLSLGLSYGELDRDVVIKDYNLHRVMESEKTTGVLGVDLFRFITVYGLAGVNQSDFGAGSSSDGEREYGVGIRLNLLDHEILDPFLTEDRIRITASIQQTRVKAEFGTDELKWDDTTATILMSLVNDLDGDGQFFPEGMAIYAGITHSTLDGDISEREASWFLVGLEMYYTKRVSFNFGADLGDNPTEGMHAGVNLRF